MKEYLAAHIIMQQLQGRGSIKSHALLWELNEIMDISEFFAGYDGLIDDDSIQIDIETIGSMAVVMVRIRTHAVRK